MTPDRGELYREHVDDLEALVGDLDDERLAVFVPATPAWTVRDVLAHLAGGPADFVLGRLDGAPGPEWTAAHVGERAHLPVAELFAEMRTHADWVAQWLAEQEVPGILYDITVHHADLHEALGHGRLPEHLWRPVLELVGPRQAPDLLGRVDDYEAFRALFSRRSREQMRAWRTGLDDERLDAVGVFGPRDDAQPAPARATARPRDGHRLATSTVRARRRP